MTAEKSPSAWTKVTIEPILPGDPDYGDWEWKSIAEVAPDVAAQFKDITRADIDTDPRLADLRANRDLGRRLAELLSANPDVLAVDFPFRVRVHRADETPAT